MFIYIVVRRVKLDRLMLQYNKCVFTTLEKAAQNIEDLKPHHENTTYNIEIHKVIE